MNQFLWTWTISRHTRKAYVNYTGEITWLIMTCTLAQPSSWSTSRICPHGLVPGLDWDSLWPPSLSMHLVAMSNPVSLFISMGRVLHLTPSLLSGWLLTNVQVNNITRLHDTHGHIYIHHIGISILLPLYTSSIFLGRPPGTDPSRLIQEALLYKKNLRKYPNSRTNVSKYH